MKKLLQILIVGMLLPLTAFSQLKADRKIDSMYCFGPTKAKEIVKTTYELERCDSMYMELSKELKYTKIANELCDSANAQLQMGIQKSEAISAGKDKQLSDKQEQNESCQKAIIKERRKRTGWTFASMLQSAAVIVSIILVVKK